MTMLQTLEETLGGDPKRAASAAKPRMSVMPAQALLRVAEALQTGAEKYGRLDWRNHDTRASTYYDACFRHLFAWWDGEDTDPESGLSHVAHAAASLLILMDLVQAGRGDDRVKNDPPAQSVEGP
jgi:hypothetical protein